MAADTSHPGVKTELGLQVPAADGVPLLTDVHRPAAGMAPVVVYRTPYGTRQPVLLRFGWLLARAGFAAVLQNVRGRYGSDGVFEPFVDEAADGRATLQWLRAQPWCDGNVVLFGVSYSSYTGCALGGDALPPGIRIRGMVSIVSMARPWRHFYRGGALVLHWALPWALLTAASRQPKLRCAALEPHLKSPLEALPDQLDFPSSPWRGWIRHADPQAAYWQDTDALPRVRSLDVPMLHIGGWYDFSLASTLELYRAMTAAHPNVCHRLILGPWEHNEVFAVLLKGLMAGTPSPPSERGEALPDPTDKEPGPWLAATLMDAMRTWCRPREADATATPPAPQVHVWRAEAGSEGQWTHTPAWPATTPLKLYPNTSGAEGELRQDSEKTSSEADAFTLRHDPDDPVPTVGGACWIAPQWMAAGALDQAELESRDDVVVFTGDALEQDLDVVGAPRLRLAVAISPDEGPADVCAKLVDVQPDGRALWVSDGLLRLPPPHGSRPRPVVIELGETCYRFRRQHRIRLELAASNFPQFDRTPQPGERRIDLRGEPPCLELPVSCEIRSP